MNKKVILLSRPQGEIKESDFKVTSEPLNATLKSGEVLVRVEWVSIDPAQRGNK
jgi:NADPH-dependent curcumin reductase CurA